MYRVSLELLYAEFVTPGRHAAVAVIGVMFPGTTSAGRRTW